MNRSKLFKKVILFECIGFAFVILFQWIDELFDIPYLLFGGTATYFNLAECIFETGIILSLALISIMATSILLGRIERIAMFDPLTNCMNRRFMIENLKHEIHRCIRSNSTFSLMLGDIDRFKQINDKHGHECGDKVLQQIAITMNNRLRAQDMICRWGGDEFLIILPDTSPDSGRNVAETLRKVIEDLSIVYRNQKVQVTISFGVYDKDYSNSSPDYYIRIADRNLYDAKNRGRNRVV
ncbi:MAG: GGDEF domain-containing protein [Candidatus Aegiribacteria sp.]|nr:GGDEF domain-containing protein [Candidatus Aegiribacteria sp.]